MVTLRHCLGTLLLGLYPCVLVNPVVARTPLEVAVSQVGVKEATGNNDGERVQAYLGSVGLKGNYPWCAAFPHWCYRQTGAVFKPVHRYARASAWHPKECRVWEKKDGVRRRITQAGDHFALYYNHLGRIGHEGWVKDETDDYIITVEGNTDGSGTREGDGVYIRKRSKRTLHCISRW